MALNVKQKYPGTQGGAAQLYASDTRLSLRRREQVFTRLSKSYKFVSKVLCVQTPTRPAALHSSCLASFLSFLLPSSVDLTCRLDFFYSNTNNLVQFRAVVLESGLGLESGLETVFYRLGLVLDSLVFGLGLVSDLVIGLAKCSSWSWPSPAIYAFFFSFKTKPLIWLACSANG